MRWLHFFLAGIAIVFVCRWYARSAEKVQMNFSKKSPLCFNNRTASTTNRIYDCHTRTHKCIFSDSLFIYLFLWFRICHSKWAMVGASKSGSRDGSDALELKWNGNKKETCGTVQKKTSGWGWEKGGWNGVECHWVLHRIVAMHIDIFTRWSDVRTHVCNF